MAMRARKQQVVIEDMRADYEAQELAWKKPREGRVGTPAELKGHWTTVLTTIGDGEAEAGLRAHRIGTALNHVYALWGEVIGGTRTFEELLAQRLEHESLPVSTAYDYMRLADATTEEEAKRYGITKALLGHRLLEHAGVGTLAKLVKVDLPVTDPRTGKPARFPATRRILERALLAYRLDALESEEGADASLEQELRRSKRAIDATLEEHPELVELRPTAYIYDGKVRVRLRAFGADHAQALAALAQRLKKAR